MKPELISFKLCPFVQKATLTLLAKDIDYDIEYIDLQNPPEWFTKISPLGKVPVLKVGNQILFESSVIIEYLDEVYAESLHPSDPLLKAQNRSWMEFGNECLMNGYNLIMADDESGFNQQREAMLSKLGQLENKLSDTPYFNGEQASLVDYSFTPFFQRQAYLDEFIPALIDKGQHTKVRRWANRLLAQDIVAQSTVPEIKKLYTGMMKNSGGYLSSLMQN